MTDCIICGNKHFTPLYEGLLLQCQGCDFITANLNYHFFNSKEIYSEDYFNGSEYLNYFEDKLGIQYNFKNRIDEIKKWSKNPAIGKCLEIGCAYGFFGEVLIQNFPQINYQGIDIASEAVRTGQEKLKINLQEIDYLDFIVQGKLSDIFMWDVIEHLPKPEKFIEKASQELEKGGRIFITTGDISTFLPSFQKRKWRMIHPPSHLHYFSKKTISLLLEKNGFTVKKVSYPSIWRSVKQIHYSLFLLNKKSGFHSALNKLIPSKLYIPINTFDIMFVSAIKN
jgi:2-polyprenyl-3-methyl-5-hydroxy-6-metoxy-1,4-benzoquinol methylase